MRSELHTATSPRDRVVTPNSNGAAMRRAIPTLALAAALASGTPGQVSGGLMHGLEPTAFANTAAASLADYAGRLLLVEYFAYW